MEYGPLTSETRVSALRVDNPVGFTRVEASGGIWLAAANGPSERLAVVEERIHLDTVYRGLEVTLAAGGTGVTGDRENYFVSVPRRTASVSARLGRNLFEATSALYVGAEYVYCGRRHSPAGGVMPAYNVINFKIDGRLLDADMYLLFLNAFNEFYQTEDGYLMTPRTFVYGLTWTLFE